MINKDDYYEDEWAELVARCKALTEGHEWRAGDQWKWSDTFGIYLYAEKDRFHVFSTDGESLIQTGTSSHFIEEKEKMIWLPRLDQLVHMDGWKGGGLFGAIDWEVSSEMLGMEAEGPTPELAVLRAVTEAP